MKTNALLYTLLLASVAVSAPASADKVAEWKGVERGRYLVVAGGCNDCHTPGYPQSAGKIPAAQWLTGSPVGFQGPWGTSYPVNLRLYVQNLTEAQWVARVREPMRPPMPWFNLRDMSDTDLIAMYRFVRSLGPAGEPAPAAVGPGVVVNTPYIEFVPKNLPKQAQAAR
jgi:mono/diheme cytochrome c family protein